MKNQDIFKFQDILRYFKVLQENLVTLGYFKILKNILRYSRIFHHTLGYFTKFKIIYILNQMVEFEIWFLHRRISNSLNALHCLEYLKVLQHILHRQSTLHSSGYFTVLEDNPRHFKVLSYISKHFKITYSTSRYFKP